MTQPGPNDALCQNVMMLGFLVASENANIQTDKHDSLVYIDYEKSTMPNCSGPIPA